MSMRSDAGVCPRRASDDDDDGTTTAITRSQGRALPCIHISTSYHIASTGCITRRRRGVGWRRTRPPTTGPPTISGEREIWVTTYQAPGLDTTLAALCGGS